MRRHNVSRQTFYAWKKRYGDLQVSDAKRLRALEDENARPKRLVADQALNLPILKDSWEKARDHRRAPGGGHRSAGVLRDQRAACVPGLGVRALGHALRAAAASNRCPTA